MRTGIVAWLWSRLVTSVSEEKSLHIMWNDSWDRRRRSASDLFMAKRARQGARGHLDRLPALLRSKWVRETNYPGLGKIAQVSLWIPATCKFGGYFKYFTFVQTQLLKYSPWHLDGTYPTLWECECLFSINRSVYRSIER